MSGDLLRSELLSVLGFRHAFSLRSGGASEGPFASFNLGRSVGDEPERVEENQRRFAASLGIEAGALYEASQVHGAAVICIREDEPANAVRAREADALVARAGGVAVGVRVADCAPVLIADTRSGAVAAVHAGWRGTVRGVLEAAVRALLEHGGGSPAALAAAVFPHIGACCFEVGDDVAGQLLGAAAGADVIDRSRAKPHVDLGAIILLKLARLGLDPSRLERVAGCTRCDEARFFSFRRQGARSGRHLAAIVARG